MKNPLSIAHKEYHDALRQASLTLASHIKSISSVKDTVARLNITRPIYYHRLKRPEAWPLADIETLQPVLGEDVVKSFDTAVIKGRMLAELIQREIDQAGISITFVCKKSGFSTNTYYRNQKEPHLWDLEKLAQMEKVIGTIKQL